MNKPRITALLATGAPLAFFCFATSLGNSAENAVGQHLVEGLMNEATPVVLDESGICMEGSRGWGTGVNLKIRIPAVSPVGKATDFYMNATQGPGRSMTTSMLLSEYDGKWAPPIYVTVWDLSHPASKVDMHVGFSNEKTGKQTKIRFSNFGLKSLLAMDDNENDSDRIFRVGCRRWDLENKAG